MLDLEGNCVEDPGQLRYLQLCPRLATLTLEGNPLCLRPGSGPTHQVRTTRREAICAASPLPARGLLCPPERARWQQIPGDLPRARRGLLTRSSFSYSRRPPPRLPRFQRATHTRARPWLTCAPGRGLCTRHAERSLHVESCAHTLQAPFRDAPMLGAAPPRPELPPPAQLLPPPTGLSSKLRAALQARGQPWTLAVSPESVITRGQQPRVPAVPQVPE